MTAFQCIICFGRPGISAIWKWDFRCLEFAAFWIFGAWKFRCFGFSLLFDFPEYFFSPGTYYHCKKKAGFHSCLPKTGGRQSLRKRGNMTQGKVEICGVNTSKLPLLKAEEKKQLFQKIEEGDAGARETYIEGNLRLVLSVIKRFASSNENVDDLFQIGCIGLIKAIDNFDSTLNVKFSTYAVPMSATCRNNYIEKSICTLLSVIVILFISFLIITFFC